MKDFKKLSTVDIIPSGDNVLISVEVQDKTASGLHIPKGIIPKTFRILAVGPQVKEAEVGDIISIKESLLVGLGETKEGTPVQLTRLPWVNVPSQEGADENRAIYQFISEKFIGAYHKEHIHFEDSIVKKVEKPKLVLVGKGGEA